MDPVSADGKTKVNDKDLLDSYNSVKGATWIAGHNEFFADMTFDEARAVLGAAPSHISEHLNNTLEEAVYAAIDDDTVPAEFDARTNWPGLIHPIRNQGTCGSCWAFSASEVFSDRVAIATGKKSPVLSAEDMVSCDTGDMRCRGGRLATAWKYIVNKGLATDSCIPYTAHNNTAPACPSSCADGSSVVRTHASKAYAINGVANMQKEIMTKGPIQIAFMVYKSFMTYKSGVYKKLPEEFLPEGGHAVKIVGWGTEKGTDYWLVANSWGTTQWGDLGGFFKIERGTNQCGVEKMGPPYAGLAAAKSSVIV
jgi:cathepsin B